LRGLEPGRIGGRGGRRLVLEHGSWPSIIPT
jgi:hypothetical protein